MERRPGNSRLVYNKATRTIDTVRARMTGEVRDALESARTIEVSRPFIHGAEPQRNRSLASVRAIVLAVVRELPDDMTMTELRDELDIAENQSEER